jgi:hypothetical protein
MDTIETVEENSAYDIEHYKHYGIPCADYYLIAIVTHQGIKCSEVILQYWML